MILNLFIFILIKIIIIKTQIYQCRRKYQILSVTDLVLLSTSWYHCPVGVTPLSPTGSAPTLVFAHASFCFSLIQQSPHPIWVLYTSIDAVI